MNEELEGISYEENFECEDVVEEIATLSEEELEEGGGASCVLNFGKVKMSTLRITNIKNCKSFQWICRNGATVNVNVTSSTLLIRRNMSKNGLVSFKLGSATINGREYKNITIKVTFVASNESAK